MTDKTSSSARETARGQETASSGESASTGEAETEARPQAPFRQEAPSRQETASQQETSSQQDAPAARPVVEVSPAVHKRLTTGLGGFALATAACMLLVLAIYVVSPRGDKDALPTVDYGSQLWAMRSDAPYPVFAPEGLPAGWRPNSSRLSGLGSGGKEPVAWHLGFVTPSEEYAALEQSNEKVSEYVPRMTNSSKPIGTQQVDGVTWTKYHRKDKKANSLARTLPSGVSVVVTGTASYQELAVLAASLKPQSKDGATLAPSPAATPAR
ncbi:DUF4245 domain-containing protein [Actinomadura chokoriensis]|uniref:DUF4245 family protein n=1 Tax=Actinomadura chokoriensis TaxID=454156 RepID=A0ABV4QQ43_9ACTN